jgi:von Willebrand factor A domain-containing protein 8
MVTLNSRSQVTDELSVAAPSLRIISTSSKSVPLKDWLTIEHTNMFFPVLAVPMDGAEEMEILTASGCPISIAGRLVHFAQKYREKMSSDVVQKNRTLGTRSLVRIARRLPWDDDLHAMLSRAIMTEFMPSVERMDVESLMQACGISKRSVLVSFRYLYANLCRLTAYSSIIRHQRVMLVIWYSRAQLALDTHQQR